MKFGDLVRLRSALDGLAGRGRSMRGIADSGRPRIANGEMSEVELGAPKPPCLDFGVKGSSLGLGDTFVASSSVPSRDLCFGLLSGGSSNALVIPRASS